LEIYNIIRKMTEKNGETTHIKCSKCKCQYINDDEHIKNDFGYSRLGKRYKTCSKCRARKKEKQQTIIKPLNKPYEVSAPTPLPYDYILNINTLNGETFTIQMLRRSEEDECQEWLSTYHHIQNQIQWHYEKRILDAFIEDNNVIIPKGCWKYGTENDGYFCGATEDVINKIKRYGPEHQKLLYNNELLTQDKIINKTIRLNNNDCITVVFTS